MAGGGGAEAADEDGGQAEAGDRAPDVTRLSHGLVGALAGGAHHPPDGDAGNEGAGDQPGGGDDVCVFAQVHAGGDELHEAAHAVELGAAGLGVEAGAHGVLHPGVRRENPRRGEHGAQGDAPDRQQVHALGEAAPAEDPQAQESGLEEEGEEGLDGQGGTEDVADEAGVFGPVHAELELLHDTGGDTEREVDEEEFAKEASCLQPVFLAGAVPRGLHDGNQQGQADRQRHEDEVVDGGNTELPSSDGDRVKRCLREGHDGTFSCWDWGRLSRVQSPWDLCHGLVLM